MLNSAKDRGILRELAKQVAEIAALPAQQETIALWKASNGLKPVRPMVMIDQIAWHEMDVGGELTLRTEDDFCRRLETRLRKTLYAWKHMRADMVVEPVLDLPKVIHGADFYPPVLEQTAVSDGKNDVVGHAYVDQLKTDEDLEKIKNPVVVFDAPATAAIRVRAQELFDGLLTVRMQGVQPNFAPWDRIVERRGAGPTLLDVADRPEFLHRLMARLTEASLSLLDQLEAKGLLAYGAGRVHCTGAYTDELPAPDFDPERPRAKDNWTAGQAQIFSSVSPRMHQEFDIAYATRWYARFGLGYYGCCEPLDNKLDIVRKLPNVRKISMSPWVKVERGAERIGRDYVFSRKPSPAFLAKDTWNPADVASDLSDTRQHCARYGCPLEFILKDISTLRYQPQRLWEWAEVAMRVAKG